MSLVSSMWYTTCCIQHVEHHTITIQIKCYKLFTCHPCIHRVSGATVQQYVIKHCAYSQQKENENTKNLAEHFRTSEINNNNNKKKEIIKS